MRQEERYRLIRLIGRGSIGEVWLAEDNLIKRQVALKFLMVLGQLGRFEGEEATRNFFREARAIVGLSHPNIATIYDIGEWEGRYFISMEYLEGETLSEVIKRGPLDPLKASWIVAQVADALAYAHANGVVHGDIKPKNVFLKPDGTVKITDFGIARMIGADAKAKMGIIIGALAYMSPEQLEGKKIDGRTDIFSTGVILYEMLSGVKPFGEDSSESTIYKLVYESPPALSSLTPHVPEWLKGVVERAIAKRPSDRFQEADELAEELRRNLHFSSPKSPVFISEKENEVSGKSPSLETLGILHSDGTEPNFFSCPACGSLQKPGNKYCGSCGLPISDPQTPYGQIADSNSTPVTIKTLAPPETIPGLVSLESEAKGKSKKSGLIALCMVLILAAGALAIFLISQSDSGADIAEEKVRESKEASNSGDYEKALALAEEAIQASGDYAPAYLARAEARIGLKNYQEALDDCSKAIELDPKQAEAYCKQGKAHLEMRQYDEAISDYHEALKKDDQCAEAYNGLGLAYRYQKNKDDCLENLRKAVGLDPENLTYRNDLAWALSSFGEYQKALEEYDAILEKNTKYYRAFLGRGHAYLGLKMPEKALEDLDKALSIKPDLFYAYLYRSDALNMLGRYEEELETTEKALQIEPDNGSAHARRGRARDALGHTDMAISDYQEAIRLGYQGEWVKNRLQELGAL